MAAERDAGCVQGQAGFESLVRPVLKLATNEHTRMCERCRERPKAPPQTTIESATTRLPVPGRTAPATAMQAAPPQLRSAALLQRLHLFAAARRSTCCAQLPREAPKPFLQRELTLTGEGTALHSLMHPCPTVRVACVLLIKPRLFVRDFGFQSF